MSNDVVRVLFLASGLWMLSSVAVAGPQEDCAALDSAAGQNSSLASPPGYCTRMNATKAAQDQYQPPGACADYQQLQSFTLGLPAVLENCGANATMPGATSSGSGSALPGSDGNGASSSQTSSTGTSNPTFVDLITGGTSSQRSNEGSNESALEHGMQ